MQPVEHPTAMLHYKNTMADLFHPIHDTNDRRAAVAAAKSKGRMTNIERASEARQKRIGRTGSFAGDSSARESNLEAQDRRPGESQTAADTRKAKAKTQTGLFVPHSVRVAELKSRGLDEKSAERVADYQSSTQGQQLGTPQFGTQSAVASDRKPPSAFDAAYENQIETIEAAEGAKSAFRDKFGFNPTDTENGGTLPGTGPGSPVTNIGKLEDAAKAAEKGETPAPAAFDNPEGKPSSHGLTGRSREERIAQAKAMPRTDGKEGTYYDQLSEVRKMENGVAVLNSRGSHTQKGKVSSAKSGTATFQMPDGSMQSVNEGESVSSAFKRIRSGGQQVAEPVKAPVKGGQQVAEPVKAPVKGGQAVAFEKQMTDSSPKKELDAVGVTGGKKPKPEKKTPEIPLYTGGSVVDEYIQKPKAEKPKSKTEVKFDVGRVGSNVKSVASKVGNLFKKPSSPPIISKRRELSNEARIKKNEAAAELSQLNKKFKQYQIASGSSVRALSGDRLEELQALAKQYGLKLDPKTGFSR